MAQDARKNINITLSNLDTQFGVDITVTRSSPGDGRSRYTVSFHTPYVWSGIAKSMSVRECEVYLQGVYDTYRMMKQAQREQDEKR